MKMLMPGSKGTNGTVNSVGVLSRGCTPSATKKITAKNKNTPANAKAHVSIFIIAVCPKNIVRASPSADKQYNMTKMPATFIECASGR